MSKWTHGPLIPRVSDGCSIRGYEEAPDIARLIAAATEMAELLQKILDRAGQLDPFTEQEARALLERINK